MLPNFRRDEVAVTILLTGRPQVFRAGSSISRDRILSALLDCWSYSFAIFGCLVYRSVQRILTGDWTCPLINSNDARRLKTSSTRGNTLPTKSS
jgi:hypothetical protein